MRRSDSPYLYPGLSARRSRTELADQVAALHELVVLHDELATRLDTVRDAADDLTLHARVREIAMRGFSACQRETAEAARSVRAHLLRLRRHPRLEDPRLASGEIAEALADAAAQLVNVADAADGLAEMGAVLHPFELAHRAASMLDSATRISGELGRRLEALKQAEKAPVPGADATCTQRGQRQNGGDVTVWYEMRVDSTNRDGAVLFALDHKGDVLNSATRCIQWAKWDLIEFKLADVRIEQVASYRVQLS